MIMPSGEAYLIALIVMLCRLSRVGNLNRIYLYSPDQVGDTFTEKKVEVGQSQFGCKYYYIDKALQILGTNIQYK